MKIKFLTLFIFSIYGSVNIFGQAFIIHNDTLSNDTIVLPPDQIQSVEIKCNKKLDNIDHQERREPWAINSVEGFNLFFNNDCHIIPDIDFSTKTLLYFPTATGGCSEPNYMRTVKLIDNKVIYHVHIVQNGYCAMLIHNNNVIVIPKINKNSDVNFEFTESYLQSPPRIDGLKNDTIVLSPEKIESVDISCKKRLDYNESKNGVQARAINSREEYFDNDCRSVGIDFATKTLLYCPVSTGGCGKFEHHQIVKIIGNKIIYNVNIIRHGKKSEEDCGNLILFNCSILIPKISKGSIVDFQVTESYTGNN